MPDSPEVQQNFNAPVYGVAGKVAGDQIIYPSSQKQDLAEAAAEIQRLLKQLEETILKENTKMPNITFNQPNNHDYTQRY